MTPPKCKCGHSKRMHDYGGCRFEIGSKLNIFNQKIIILCPCEKYRPVKPKRRKAGK